MNPNFDEIQTKIQEHFADQKQAAYFLDDKHYKLPLSDSFFCAEDITRNRKFFAWIKAGLENIWKDKSWSRQDNTEADNEIIVVDAWSGTWILGIYALLLGADKCHFLEENPFALAYNKELVEYFGLSDKSIFVECDAINYQMPESYDLLVSETLSSGFVEEDFAWIINNLKKYLKSDWMIIPKWFDLKIEEFDTNGKKLLEHSVKFVSHELWEEAWTKINLKHKDTKKLKFFMDAKMAEDIVLESGDCMSFLNEREWNLEDKHPVIEIIAKIE